VQFGLAKDIQIPVAPQSVRFDLEVSQNSARAVAVRAVGWTFW